MSEQSSPPLSPQIADEPASGSRDAPGTFAGQPMAGELSEAELMAAAYLSRVAEPAVIALWLFVQELGYVEAAAAIRSGDVPEEIASCTDARRFSADPAADLAAAERNEIRLVTPASADWPHFAFAAMRRLATRRAAEWLTGRRSRPPRGELIPPLALWVRGPGDLSTVGVQSAALVGSRAASGYGEHVAAEFGYGLARRDVTVVSGGAYGIDAAAHRGSLAADGPSVLVSAGGLDRPYPAAHRGLYDRVAETGLLLSERPPGSAPHRQRFLSRNRLIAALGAATVVVEAGHRSGALNTAGHARDLGRPVLAVPGPITSAMSVGCHRLLQRDEQPAFPVTSVGEVLGFCAGAAEQGIDAVSEPAATYDRPSDALDADARAVLDGFPARRTVTESELARASGQPLAAVRAALPVLASLGLVASTDGGHRLVR